VPLVAPGRTEAGSIPWAPGIGVDFPLVHRRLSLTFALLISGIGSLIVLFFGGYLKGHPRQGRFFSFILLFMGAMQGSGRPATLRRAPSRSSAALYFSSTSCCCPASRLHRLFCHRG
jgi:hypothetical protein